MDGRTVDHVYVTSAKEYIETVGSIWPEDLENGAGFISVNDVKSLKKSVFRLPLEISEKIYSGGETAMGFYRFTLVFKDNSKQTFETPSCEIDFFRTPDGRSPNDITDVILHKKLTTVIRISPTRYCWLLYGYGENHKKSWYGPGISFSNSVPIKRVRQSKIKYS